MHNTRAHENHCAQPPGGAHETSFVPSRRDSEFQNHAYPALRPKEGLHAGLDYGLRFAESKGAGLSYFVPRGGTGVFVITGGPHLLRLQMWNAK
jgi:hypothetical protein